MKNRFLKVSEIDNVATAISDLKNGEVFGDVTLLNDIKSGHKFALTDIKKGDFIIKYGEVIGAASIDIKKGEWVHTNNTEGVRGRGDSCDSSKLENALKLSIESANKKNLNAQDSKHEKVVLKGYRREDGKFGLRNKVLIIPSVVCANKVVENIARACPEAVYVTHQHGCSQLDFDAEQTRMLMAGNCANSNVYAALVVGLGCETISSNSVKELAKSLAPYKDVRAISIQELGGITNTTNEGIKIVKEMLENASKCKLSEGDFSDIILGTECGGSDAYSGLSANPSLGSLSDYVVENGGAVILAETTELIGAENILARRAINAEVEKKIYEKIYGFEENVKNSGSDIRGANPSPGNIAGGLTTIEEKSLGCVYKAGTTKVVDVIDYAMPVTKKGLTFMDTPGNDIEQLSAMVAGGANLVVFTTGRGTPTGSPTTPTIKLSTNNFCATNMADVIDLNAGEIVDGNKCKEDIRDELIELIKQISEGKLTKAEINKQNDFSVWRLATTC